MSIAEAERAAKVRAEERLRARAHANKLGASGALLAQIVGDDVSVTSVQLDENDAGIDSEVAAAQDLRDKITAVDGRLGVLHNELAAAKKARTQLVLILIGVGVVALVIVSQMLK